MNESIVKNAQALQIGEPMLPSDPRSFYRQKYFESCDLLVQELNDRFFQRDVKPIITLESLLMKSANGDSCVQELSDMKESIFSTDVCMDKLENQLRIVVDVIRVELPEVKKVTSIRTICDAMAQHVNKDLLSEVHLLLRLYLTFPITSSTSERSFSALRRLFTYLRSSLSENRLNQCFLLHVHKELTETLNVEEIAREFIATNDERMRYFGKF
ncbi:hypothetical protein EMCRGX_G004385 [Ephydatia muelleri]